MLLLYFSLVVAVGGEVFLTPPVTAVTAIGLKLLATKSFAVRNWQ